MAGAGSAALVPDDLPGVGQPQPLWRRLAGHRLFVTGAVIIVFMVLLAIFADFVQLLPPGQMQVRLRFLRPDFAFPLASVLANRFSGRMSSPRYSLRNADSSSVALVTGIA